MSEIFQIDQLKRKYKRDRDPDDLDRLAHWGYFRDETISKRRKSVLLLLMDERACLKKEKPRVKRRKSLTELIVRSSQTVVLRATYEVVVSMVSEVFADEPDHLYWDVLRLVDDIQSHSFRNMALEDYEEYTSRAKELRKLLFQMPHRMDDEVRNMRAIARDVVEDLLGLAAPFAWDNDSRAFYVIPPEVMDASKEIIGDESVSRTLITNMIPWLLGIPMSKRLL